MDDTNPALLAWEILGVIVGVGIIFLLIKMIPELRRYFLLKSM
jgi:hypothetical protein